MLRSLEPSAKRTRGLLERCSSALLLATLCVVGCSGGTRRAPIGALQSDPQADTQSTAQSGAKEVTAAPSGRPKCTRRHLVSTDDGRELIVYTEDTGSCDPVRAAALTRVAAD